LVGVKYLDFPSLQRFTRCWKLFPTKLWHFNEDRTYVYSTNFIHWFWTYFLYQWAKYVSTF
jgi:hypothetical protein